MVAVRGLEQFRAYFKALTGACNLLSCDVLICVH